MTTLDRARRFGIPVAPRRQAHRRYTTDLVQCPACGKQDPRVVEVHGTVRCTTCWTPIDGCDRGVPA